MKTTKLISLTTLASVALLAIAPAAGVHAATGYDASNPNTDGSLNAMNGKALTAPTVNPDDNKTTTADPGAATAATANDKTGSATATSEAWARVISGYLTLDAVPDLYFGTVVAGGPAALKDNTSVRTNDGNDRGLLQVTDSRSDVTDPAKPVNGLGYLVQAQLGKFNSYKTVADASSNTNPTEAQDQDKWVLTLNGAKGLTTSTGAKSDASLATAELTANGAGAKVITAAAGHGFGLVKTQYTDTQDATLNVPQSATQGYYVADLTWTLNADANAAVNAAPAATPAP